MIVKNESKIIAETLHNISKYIDYWIISDTGSTDNTIDYEKYLNSKIINDLYDNENYIENLNNFIDKNK